VIEKALAAALAVPWIACATGWAYVVTGYEIVRWVRR